METVLLVVQFILALFLIAVVLLQRTAQDGGGLAGGGGTMGGLFTARGSANVLTRTTAVLATLFILNSLTLGFIASSRHQTRSLVDQLTPETAPAAPAETKPAAPVPAEPKKAPEAPQVPLGQ
jgi:preprotein translocase subunit SecG